MSVAREMDVGWKKKAVDVILVLNLLRQGLEKRRKKKKKGVMGRGGGVRTSSVL